MKQNDKAIYVVPELLEVYKEAKMLNDAINSYKRNNYKGWSTHPLNDALTKLEDKLDEQRDIGNVYEDTNDV